MSRRDREATAVREARAAVRLSVVTIELVRLDYWICLGGEPSWIIAK